MRLAIVDVGSINVFLREKCDEYNYNIVGYPSSVNNNYYSGKGSFTIRNNWNRYFFRNLISFKKIHKYYL